MFFPYHMPIQSPSPGYVRTTTTRDFLSSRVYRCTIHRPILTHHDERITRHFYRKSRSSV